MQGRKLIIKAFRSHENGMILRAHEMTDIIKRDARNPLVFSCDPKPVQQEGSAREGQCSHFSLDRALVPRESKYWLCSSGKV